MAEFTTKDSGERRHSSNGMQRDTNSGKARFDLIWPKGVPYDEQFMTRIANLMARGAAKYEDRNWEKGTYEEDYERALESAERHFNQYKCGDRSEDHAAGVFFNLLAAVTYEYKHGVESKVEIANEELARRREIGGFRPPVLGSDPLLALPGNGCGCSGSGPCYDHR